VCIYCCVQVVHTYTPKQCMHMCGGMYMYMYACVYVRVYVCMYVCVCVCVCIRTCMCMHVYVCMCMRVCIRTCMCMHVYVCAHLYSYTLVTIYRRKSHSEIAFVMKIPDGIHHYT